MKEIIDVDLPLQEQLKALTSIGLEVEEDAAAADKEPEADDGDEDLELENYPGSIAQILTNLVLNSVIHGFPENQQGQISIHAQTDGTYAHLVYRDTGKGIEPENLPRIFDPFFTTNRGAGGSGLGLNIVYNLVTQKLGGTVKCESAPDAGVTMTILIPIRLGIAA